MCTASRQRNLTCSKVCKPINLLVATNASIRTVFWNDEPISIQCNGCVSDELVPFDEDLIVRARVDGLVQVVFVEIVVDVLVTALSVSMAMCRC